MAKRIKIGSLFCMALGILLFLAMPVFGQIPLAESVKDAVSFLFPTDGHTVGVGTAFNVKLDGQNAPGYLVTAKHVLMSDAKKYYPRLCIKINNNKGGSDFIPIGLSGPNAVRVFVHSEDSDVDIAVIPASDIPLSPGRTAKDYDITTVSVSAFATKEHFAKRYIQVGDEAFLTGWFSSFYGTAQNYPIARFGRLAMAPDEKIPWRDGSGVQMLQLYLVEAHTTTGNSGSPVFFRAGLQREPGTFLVGRQTLFLAGVLKGYFGALGQANSGIAAVVPAFQLKEILFSEEVMRQRASPRLTKAPDTRGIEECIQAEKHVRKSLGQP